MKENEKNIPPAEEEDDKIHVSKSVFQTAKDIQQQRLDEMKKQEEELQQKLAEREKKRREAYDRRILEEKKELLIFFKHFVGTTHTTYCCFGKALFLHKFLPFL